MCACMLSYFCLVQLYATLWTVAHQAPLSMRFSRQEYWSVLPCPTPGDLPDPGLEPTSPMVLLLQANSLQLSYLECLLMSFICLKQTFGFLLSLRKKIYVCTVLRLFRLSPTPASLNPFSVPLPLVLYTSTMANGI